MAYREDLRLTMPRWPYVLLSIGEGKKYIAEVAKELDITYSHLSRIVMTFEKKGLIETEVRGRIKFLTLTRKGKLLAAAATDLNEVCP